MLHRVESSRFTETVSLFQAVKNRMEEQGIPQWDHIYPAERDFLEDMESGTAFGWIEDNRLLTYGVLNELCNPEYGEVEWETPDKGVVIVHRLAVDPQFQGRWLARQTMKALEEEARNQGYRSVRLDAFLLNPAALHLYESLDYRRAGTIILRKGNFAVFEKALY